MTSAWLAKGSVCLGRAPVTGDEQILMDIGIANASVPAHGRKYGFEPCLRMPALDRAFVLSRKYFLKLPLADRRALLQFGL